MYFYNTFLIPTGNTIICIEKDFRFYQDMSAKQILERLYSKLKTRMKFINQASSLTRQATK